MLGHNTVRKHLHFRGHKGSVKKAYVHRAFKGSNPLYILFYSTALKMATVYNAVYTQSRFFLKQMKHLYSCL
jgi:hypothetical protein